MAVHADWADEGNTLVRYDIEGNWTWDEFYPVLEKALQMERSMPHRVDVIVDLRQSGRFPANLLLHVKNLAEKQPDNIGLSVVVTTNQFVHSLYNVGIKFSSKIAYYFRFARTFEEALAIIAAERERLGVAPTNPLTGELMSEKNL